MLITITLELPLNYWQINILLVPFYLIIGIVTHKGEEPIIIGIDYNSIPSLIKVNRYYFLLFGSYVPKIY